MEECPKESNIPKVDDLGGSLGTDEVKGPLRTNSSLDRSAGSCISLDWGCMFRAKERASFLARSNRWIVASKLRRRMNLGSGVRAQSNDRYRERRPSIPSRGRCNPRSFASPDGLSCIPAPV